MFNPGFIHEVIPAFKPKPCPHALQVAGTRRYYPTQHNNFCIKNPAYGRQSICRPMRIVAPIPQ